MLEGIKHLFGKLKRNPHQVEVKEILDPNSIELHQTIKHQQNAIAELQGEKARKDSEEGLERASERDFKEEDEIKKRLNEEDREINTNDETYFSLGNFFFKLFRDKKFRESISATTFNRKEVISRIGDILLSKRGMTLVDEKRNVILEMQRPKDIFQSISALGNDVQSMKIPINLDEKGRYIENIMEYVPAEMYKVGGKIFYKASSKKAIYEIQAEKDEEIAELMEKNEEQEETIQKLQHKVDELQSSNNINQNSAEISRNVKSKIIKEATEIEKAFHPLAKDLTSMQKVHEIDEDTISKLNVQVGKLKAEAERQGSTPSQDEALRSLENMLNILKKNRMIPKTEKPTPAQ